jgi:hypothetical protein
MPIEVALVAIAGMGTFLAMIWMTQKAKVAKFNALRGGGEDAARLERIVAETSTEVARLRERVQVLEKLVTDDDRRLASEIERLRPPEARG